MTSRSIQSGMFQRFTSRRLVDADHASRLTLRLCCAACKNIEARKIRMAAPVSFSQVKAQLFCPFENPHNSGVTGLALKLRRPGFAGSLQAHFEFVTVQ